MLPETFRNPIVTSRVRWQSIKTRITHSNRGGGKTFEFLCQGKWRLFWTKIANSTNCKSYGRRASRGFPNLFQAKQARHATKLHGTTRERLSWSTEIGSAWSDVRVDVSSLRRALELPNYLLFRDGEDIYRPMLLPELPKEDNKEDNKHANQQN